MKAGCQHILTINRGSSSLKFALFSHESRHLQLIVDGVVDGISRHSCRLRLENKSGDRIGDRRLKLDDGANLTASLFEILAKEKFPGPDIVGHRLVHGGPHFVAPVVVNQGVRRKLAALVDFAPLHLPVELSAVEFIAQKYPRLKQVACFDTAFHTNMPAHARHLNIASKALGKSARRYGFHGLSYEYAVWKLGHRRLGRSVVAHLGNGASLAAIDHGKPIDTTMGYSTAGGIPMSTRSGDIDPGIILRWLRATKGNVGQLEQLIFKHSGLRAISGTTGDMAALLSSRTQSRTAADAIDYFCYHVRQRIGALTAALGGIDSLVFTGGIGEHCAVVREKICTGLKHLGIEIDSGRNARHAPIASRSKSRVVVHVLHADEDLMIARHVARLLGRR